MGLNKPINQPTTMDPDDFHFDKRQIFKQNVVDYVVSFFESGCRSEAKTPSTLSYFLTA